MNLEVSIPSGRTLCTNHITKAMKLEIDGKILQANLCLLDMKDFDVISGMDWLRLNHAIILCHKKKVLFHRPREEEFRFFGAKFKSLPPLVSAIQVERYIFPEDLPGIPQDRQMKFTIDLVPGAAPGAPVLFVKKNDGSMRMCIDYRELNLLTIKKQILTTKNRRFIRPVKGCNSVFKDRLEVEYLDKFVIVFIDDVLVYSKDKKQHEKQL
ncbi:uncharacterized protein LOC111378371 [Olea europaea var. sylvestris]|uniref:uncharacterized protein LOC111378371 n=1 Tax=Olea europaea var. sylvestris TaxID=158386 RepID=UPI000C1D1265|nr:uncharacterized protein LOC111378371 [Olea europaea var. sylvestris]